MRKADVEELFKLVDIGDVVEMVSEPTPEVARIFGAAEPVASGE